MFAEARRLGELISRPDTIVFVGAGVSNWSGLPTWRELLQRLAEFLVENGRSAMLVERELANNDLLLAASFGFHQLNRNERCEFLRRHCHAPLVEPAELHRAIVGLGARCFITTNYDGLLERALREHRPGEYFDVVTPLQQIEIATVVQAKSEGFVFKPHGDISSCDSIVLTREDYREMQGARRNVLEAMRTLLVSRPVLFVGFGLRDPDFLLVRDLISLTFGANPAGHYALMPDVPPAEVDYWNRSYGIRIIPYATDQAASGSGAAPPGARFDQGDRRSRSRRPETYRFRHPARHRQYDPGARQACAKVDEPNWRGSGSDSDWSGVHQPS
ncbi:SIR2 family protein [Micromonospora orduensis]|uniref:SIR2 family protein n=1 Tax=Micromonospora orduensis TaxID=1420891 RepID=UPI00142ED3F1|nr:SIR2 family protein [Micromonospora orduensis]